MKLWLIVMLARLGMESGYDLPMPPGRVSDRPAKAAKSRVLQ